MIKDYYDEFIKDIDCYNYTKKMGLKNIFEKLCFWEENTKDILNWDKGFLLDLCKNGIEVNVIDKSRYEKSDKKSINFYQIDSYCRQLKSRHKNYDVFGCLLYANNNMTCITDSVPPDGDAYWLIDTYDFNINQDFDGIKKDIKNIVDKYIM